MPFNIKTRVFLLLLRRGGKECSFFYVLLAEFFSFSRFGAMTDLVETIPCQLSCYFTQFTTIKVK